MSITIPSHNAPDTEFEELLKSCTKIGEGTSRLVYEIPEHNDKVLKVSKLASNFPNWSEIVAYHYNKDDGKLAEIFSWSLSGKFIVMERLTPLEPGEASTYKFPEYLTDRKPSNLGKDRNNEIKALDYASLKFPESYDSPFS